MAEFDRLVVSILVDEIIGGFFINVPPGHIACVYDRGQGVLQRTWGPGLHLKIPFWQVAKIFNAQTIEYGIREGFDLKNPETFGDEPINVVSHDNKLLRVEGAILFRIDKTMVPQLWESVGENFVSKIVRPIARSRIRGVLARFPASEIMGSKREEIENLVQVEFEKFFQEKSLICEKVLFSEIKPVLS